VLAVSIIRAMTEAASTSETSVNFYQTKRRNNPEDSHLHTRRRENLKSHKENGNLIALTKTFREKNKTAWNRWKDLLILGKGYIQSTPPPWRSMK
jgi:hypothetical protein